MKTIIIIIASFLCVNLFAQHQAQFDEETPHKKVFKEVFNNAFETRQNGGTISNVTFDDGSVVFNGSLSVINYNALGSDYYTIRLKLYVVAEINPSSSFNIFGSLESTAGILAFGSVAGGLTNETFSIWGDNTVNATYIRDTIDAGWNEIVLSWDGGTYDIYLNGVAKTTYSIGSACELQSGDIYIGKRESAAQYFTGSFDLIEIFNEGLTAEEVSNLYNEKRYEELNITPILEVTAERGVIESDSSFVNTDVDVVRDGSVWVQKYDGAGSKLTFGEIGGLTGNLTISAWINPSGWGEGNDGRIFDNSKVLFYLRYGGGVDERLRFSSDGAVTLINSAAGSIDLNKWQHVLITRTSAGISNFYINGVLSGSVNQSSGTPTSGSSVIVGNNSVQSRTFNGNILYSKIYNSILTTYQISQIYTSEKRKLGL